MATVNGTRATQTPEEMAAVKIPIKRSSKSER